MTERIIGHPREAEVELARGETASEVVREFRVGAVETECLCHLEEPLAGVRSEAHAMGQPPHMVLTAGTSLAVDPPNSLRESR